MAYDGSSDRHVLDHVIEADAQGTSPGDSSSHRRATTRQGLGLVSPLSREPLVHDGDRLATPDGKEFYPVRNGTPILVNVDSSIIGNMVLAGDGASAVKRHRRKGLSGAIKRLLSPAKPETQRNIAAFCAALKQLDPMPVVLIIGGGTVGQGVEALYADHAIRCVSFDIYAGEAIDFIADAHAIPLEDQSVHGVLVQAVLEHVLDPRKVVDEIWRVLADGGLVYAETPFLQQVHEGPYDFTRFTHSGHRWLFRRFEELRSGVCGGAGTQLLWTIDYFFRALFRSRAVGKAMKLCFFWLAYCDRISSRRHTVDTASGFYLLGRKSNEDLAPASMPSLYAGGQ